ncbi:MAG TPA: thioredoxin domain-containing protein [bacterium]
MNIRSARVILIGLTAVLFLTVNCKSEKIDKEKTTILIEEFSDFQCPFCERVQPTLKELKKEYGDRLEIRFRHFPLRFHNFATQAAIAAECARDQGKFWEMHNELFANQSRLDIEAIKGAAFKIGLDGEKFVKCLESGEKQNIIEKDLEDGKARGVSGTPTFFINGAKLVGAQPVSEFQKVINQLKSK